MKLGRYGSRELMKLQILDYQSSTPVMYMDYANTSSQEIQSSRVYAMGNGTRRIAWDGEKTATLTVETQIFSMEHLALLAGEEIKRGKQNIYKTQVLTVTDVGGKLQVTLSKTPIGGKTEFSAFLFENGIISNKTPIPVATITDKIVEFDSTATIKAGDEVEVYYRSEVLDAAKLSFTAKGFPKYVKLIGDTFYSDEVATESEVALVQMVYYKAKLQPNFTIATSSEGDPSALTLVFDLFPQKVEGTDTLIDMILYEDE
ncbi:hypothetical protein MHB54_27925 [Paenibacillus sp. FSL M7-0802]|uniref:hypothetical protein n=1 Tax=Paenibacillus sp. FSL M7-0802 TaxID=2921536 RepID=UPI0030FC90C0